MKTIVLIDTRDEIPGQSIGTIIGAYPTIAAAFAGNEAFQVRMRANGEKSHIRTKIVTLKAPLAPANTSCQRTLRNVGPQAGKELRFRLAYT